MKMEKLSEKEKEIVKLCIEDGNIQEYAAYKLGISQPAVSQKLKSAKEKLEKSEGLAV